MALKAPSPNELQKKKEKIKARPKSGVKKPKGIPGAENLYLQIATQLSREIQDAAKGVLELGTVILEEPSQNVVHLRKNAVDYEAFRARMERYRQRLLEILSTDRITEMVREVARYASSSNAFDLARVLGVRPIELEGGLLETWISENVKLIQGLAAKQTARVEEVIQKASEQGLRFEAIAADVQKATGKSLTEAKLIARDQSLSINGQLTKQRHKQLGIHKYEWSTSNDSRVRDNHQELGGKVFDWESPPQGGGTGPNDYGHPGSGILCLPGDSKLNAAPGLLKIYRRPFTGELTELITENGMILRATPNHPVLTESGMRAIQDLQEGDEVVSKVQYHGFIRHIENNRTKPQIEQLFDALFVHAPHAFVHGIGADFHGDRTDDKVDIFDAMLVFTNETDSAIAQKLAQLELTEADASMVFRFFEGCAFDTLQSMTIDMLTGQMRSLELSLTLLLAHLSPLELFCLALRPELYFSGYKEPSDNATIDGKMCRNSLLALSVLIHGSYAIRIELDTIVRNAAFSMANFYPISPDVLRDSVRMRADDTPNLPKRLTFGVKANRIIKKNRVHVSCPVYNLETKTGYYVAQDVFISNCRCVAKPILPTS